MRFRDPASWTSAPGNKPTLLRCLIFEGNAELCQPSFPESPLFDVLPNLDFMAGPAFSFLFAVLLLSFGFFLRMLGDLFFFAQQGFPSADFFFVFLHLFEGGFIGVLFLRQTLDSHWSGSHLGQAGLERADFGPKRFNFSAAVAQKSVSLAQLIL